MNILVIDDEIQPGSPVFGTVSWLKEKYSSTKIYVSRCARCTTNDFGDMGDKPGSPTGTISALNKFLETIDILILDLAGLGPLQEDKSHPLTTDKIKQNLNDVGRKEIVVSGEDLHDLKDSFTGIGFYHHHYTSLRKVQAVFVVTQYDRGERILEKDANRPPETDEERIVRTLIDPFCGIDQWRPYTAKYSKDREGGGLLKLRERIGCMAELFHDSGYISLDNLSGIEFAAFHDKAVMLVGESGTGKEYAAKFIHRRWIQEKIRAGVRYFQQEDPDRHFVAVNCSVLTESLADSLLFGHARGAFTGATYESLGLILGKGCGQGDRSRWQRDGQDFTLPSLGDKVPKNTPRGTLFLDEFGDLHANVQAKLLRYLQEWEVPMMGLNGGVVKDAALRIIAATSDPRFAAFAGYYRDEDRLRGQYRTTEELQRPLRPDLLFRVKGQTIRIDPVTAGPKGNVSDVVDRFIRHSGSATKWEPGKGQPDPRQRLIEKITTLIEAVETTDNGPYRPVFGHKREIRNAIDLIEVFADTALRRGGRPSSADGITVEHVESMFRPGGVLIPLEAPARVGGGGPDPDGEENKVRSDIRTALVECGRSDLAGGWTEDDIKSLIPTLSTEQKKILEVAVRGKPRKRYNPREKAARLRAIGDPAVREDTPGLGGKIVRVRNWFNKPGKTPTP